MRKLQIKTIEGEEHELEVDGLLVDNDGTVVDTAALISEARLLAFKDHGLQAPPDDVLNGRHDSDVCRIAREHQEESLRPLFDELWGRVCSAFSDFSLDYLRGERGRLQLFNDVRESELLDQLDTVMVTNAGEAWFKAFRDNPNFGDFYSSMPVVMPVMNGQKIGEPKPAPDLLLHAKKEYGFSRPVMIGDTRHDVSAALAAGVPAIHVHRGSDLLCSNPSSRVYVVRGFGDIQVCG